jgi:hypothetical protein
LRKGVICIFCLPFSAAADPPLPGLNRQKREAGRLRGR